MSLARSCGAQTLKIREAAEKKAAQERYNKMHAQGQSSTGQSLESRSATSG